MVIRSSEDIHPTVSASWRVWLFSWIGQLAVMGPVVRGRFFCDDWELLLADPHRVLGRVFLVPSPYDLYRPLQLLAVAASQAWLGPSTLAVHLLTALVHSLTCVVVWRIALTWTRSRVAAWLAVALLSLSQFTIATTGSNDTLSLALATLGGSLIFWCVIGRARPSLPAILAALVLALLGKESAVGYLLALVLWSAWKAVQPGTRRFGLVTVIATMVLTFVYLGWRGHVTGWIPGLDAKSCFHFGANLVTNPGLLLLPVFLPLSTCRVFAALHFGHLWLPAVCLLVSAAGWLLVLWAARQAIGSARSLALLAFSLAGIVAVLPLRHVSEVYTYGALPGVAVLFGAAIHRLTSDRRLRWPVALTVAVWLGTQALIAHDKAREMFVNGEKAARLVDALRTASVTWPRHATIVLVDDAGPRRQYSLFQMDGFRLVPEDEVARVTGRADVTVIRGPAPRATGAVVLVELMGNQLRVKPRDG